MQSVSSRIWTRVAVSISYDDNYYTTGTSMYVYIVLYVLYGNATLSTELLLVLYLTLIFYLKLLCLNLLNFISLAQDQMYGAPIKPHETTCVRWYIDMWGFFSLFAHFLLYFFYWQN